MLRSVAMGWETSPLTISRRVKIAPRIDRPPLVKNPTGKRPPAFIFSCEIVISWSTWR